MGLIVFRCDASLRIGSGHVMRCRTLARSLRRRGFESIFLCRHQPGDLISLLQLEFRVLVLSTCHPIFISHEVEQGSTLSGRNLYSGWLGCSEEQDAMDSLAALQEAKLVHFTWLVLDHYGLAASWQNCIQEGLFRPDGSTTPLLVLDDLADRVHEASVLMDASRLVNEQGNSYEDLVPKSCIKLLGPAYALLDPIYSRLQPLLPIRSHLSRVLVYFGATDADNYCAIALRALCHDRLMRLPVDVVIGADAPHRHDLESQVTQRPNTRLHVALPSLAGLIARADLAIGAAGTTSWERACLGLPSLIEPLAENQQQGACVLEAAGVARCLYLSGSVNPVATVQASLIELLDSPETLHSMSEACFQLGDGRGLARMVAYLIGFLNSFRLRPAESSDLWLYHWWASDPRVRINSVNSELISLEQHRSWFACCLNSSLVLLRVLEDCDGLPLGQIRFERSSENDSRAVISFSIDRLARGRGLVSQLLELGMAELASCWGASCEAYGEVRVDNQLSCRAFLRVGFHECQSPSTGVRCFVKSIKNAS